MARTLRSKRLRAALWIGADGRCAICGVEVDDWEADHITPWALGGPTAISNLQVTCRGCNVSKGIQCYRPHQQKCVDRMANVAAGILDAQRTVCDCGPGSGKTILIMGSLSTLIDRGFASQAIIVVPNGNLRDQVEKEWARLGGSLFNPSGIQAIGKKSGGAPVLRRGDRPRVAIVTYQLVAANLALFVDFVRSSRTVLALDEFGLCSAEQTWGALAEALDAGAVHTIIASGTLFRHDGGRLPLVTYEKDDKGRDVCAADVTYKIRDSVADKATVPIEFRRVNARVSYYFKGDERAVDMCQEVKGEEGKKLDTFLSDAEVVHSVIDLTLSEHAAYVRQSGHQSRVIVVCPWQRGNVACAEEVADYIRRKHGLEVVLAISDNDNADEELKRFREQKKGHVIVTVAKASIGLDVPDLTHMAYLSKYRSLPYSLQAWLRVGRFDSSCGIPWERQHGFVFLPADPRNIQNVEWIEHEQAVALRIVEERERAAADATTTSADGDDDFVPLGAELGGVSTAAPMSGVPRDTLARAAELAKAANIEGVPHTALAEFLRLAQAPAGAASAPQHETAVETPSERIAKLGRLVQGLASKRDRLLGLEHGKTNKRLVEKFSKNRREWSEDHFARAIAWLREELDRAGGEAA